MSDSEKRSWFQRLTGRGATDKSAKTDMPKHTETPEVPDDIATEDTVVDEVTQNIEVTPASEPISTPDPATPPTPEAPAQTPAPATAVDPALAPTSAPNPVKKKSWFQRLKDGLSRSASALAGGISGIFDGSSKLDDDMLEDLEDLLITSDLGVHVAGELTESLRQSRYDKDISAEEVRSLLAQEVENIMTPVAQPLKPKRENRPHVILMTGVNGAGKTTTIGKLAKQYRDQGLSVMMAAGDTFRAAAVEQLSVWGQRVGVPVITKETGSDAAALAYEAMEQAIAEDVDVLLIDTAGRLQNREELMDELAKVVRVINKKMDGAPHDTLIVLDATTGQNAVHQVEVFQKIANITGIVMTKLDGSARGGVLVACADKFQLPIHAIGVGEAIEDLAAFDPKEFAQALTGQSDKPA